MMIKPHIYFYGGFWYCYSHGYHPSACASGPTPLKAYDRWRLRCALIMPTPIPAQTNSFL